MLELLKERVCRANLDLVRHRLVKFTWGNVSERDPESGRIVIKPSGVAYENLTPEDMVVVGLDGEVVEGKWKPSSDTMTHLVLYQKDPGIGGITHTHSTFATAYAQSGRPIRCYGTTHADYFYGEIPCTREMLPPEIDRDYERNTGLVIWETLQRLSSERVPGILVKSHGVFSFGKDAAESVYHATVMEEVAKMAYLSEQLNREIVPAGRELVDKHFFRKHGEGAYYGQGGRTEGNK